VLSLLVFGVRMTSLHAQPLPGAATECATIRESASQTPDSSISSQLCSLAETGRLDSLRWPDCSSLRAEVKQLYSPEYSPVWILGTQPTQQAHAMIELFRTADKKGLDPEDYDAERWASLLKALSAAPRSGQELARFDFALTISSLRYISDLYQGRVTPKECQVELPEKHFDAARFLRDKLIHAPDAGSAMEELEPPFQAYRRTVAALDQYVSLVQQGNGPVLPRIRRSLHPGESYDGVPELAGRLRQLGDLHGDVSAATTQKYEGPLVVAVTAFQQRHGLQADGIIGEATFEELAVPLSRRIAQMKMALERWRWLPRELGPRVLIVNIPEFRLRGYDDHRTTITMRAIVGEAVEHQTPVFADQMESIVFRPYWNVPESIQRKELVPLLRGNPAYLAKHKMEIVNKKEEVVAVSSVDSNTLNQLASGKLLIRQQPGPANSLGLIKFVFPNHFDVYMHGTPQRELFYQARRDFSHGCIRIEAPAALAAWVLRDRPDWTEKRILAAMTGKKPVSVKLARPIPVLILYNSVYVEENGEVHFFRDIYGQDALLEEALASGRH
jgi:murein L,D-transpeptidase YcbB/YkuD